MINTTATAASTAPTTTLTIWLDDGLDEVSPGKVVVGLEVVKLSFSEDVAGLPESVGSTVITEGVGEGRTVEAVGEGEVVSSNN